MVFFVVSLVVLVFSLCDYIRDSAIKRLVVLLLLVCLAVFSAFRGLRTDSYFGYDTNNYVIWFDGLTPFRFSGRLEFGFFFIGSVVKALNADSRALFLTVSVLTFTFLFLSLERNTRKPFLTILCYVAFFYYVRDFGQIRAALAYAIVTYGLRFAYDRQFARFLLTVLVAGSVHNSAFLALPVYMFPKLKLSDRGLFVIVTAALLAFGVQWLGALSGLLAPLSRFGIVRALLNYTRASAGVGLDAKRMIVFAIAYLAILFRERFRTLSPNYDVHLLMLVCGLVLLALFHESAVLAVRLPEVFLTPIVFIIPLFVYCVKGKLGKVLVHYLLAAFLYCYNTAIFLSLGHLFYR
jgi:hypothetical protein